MFHVKHVRSAARYCGIDLTDGQFDLLGEYADFLRGEAYRAGGIGPGEPDRLEKRHLADSILFASQLGNRDEIWDLGTGVGLPGVPLAIVLPDTSFVLVDRSSRRVQLLRRVVRILDLPNCQVVEGEIEDLTGDVTGLVARASLPPPKIAEVGKRLLRHDGRAVVGGSWTKRPDHDGWETVEIPRFVLDQTVWLLIMRHA